MNLFPLSKSPKQTAMEMADVHIDPIITFSCCAINAVLHRQLKDKILKLWSSKLKVSYSYLGVDLLQPMWKTTPLQWNDSIVWVEWMDEDYDNLFWVYLHCFFLNRERQFRFDLPSHPDWKKMENWNNAGLYKLLRGAGEKAMFPTQFPLTPSARKFRSTERGIFDAYTQFYASLLKKGKPRWTKRTMPPQFAAPSVANTSEILLT